VGGERESERTRKRKYIDLNVGIDSGQPWMDVEDWRRAGQMAISLFVSLV
jgi:hypothetical protein